MSERIAYVEGESGASGDMILASLLDLGAPLEKLNDTLRALDSQLSVEATTVTKAGIRALSIHPRLPEKQVNSWCYRDFVAILDKNSLPKTLKEKTTLVLRRIAEAEAKIHQKPIEELHFHELGGWDTLLDIVGVLSVLDLLEITEIHVGPLNVGSGIIKSEHGTLPVPAPVVTELMTNFPLYSSGVRHELLTPTGAALLSTLGKPSASLPPMTFLKVGCGGGERELAHPNVLRIFMGTPPTLFQHDSILKLESNLDDMNPQLWEHVFITLYDAGALEVYLTPTLMKKNRPAQILTILAPLDKESILLDILFKETTTLGVRKEKVSRVTLERKFMKIETPFGSVTCKIGLHNGIVVNVAPEYESMKQLAQQHHLPLKQLYQEVSKLIIHENSPT